MCREVSDRCFFEWGDSVCVSRWIQWGYSNGMSCIARLRYATLCYATVYPLFCINLLIGFDLRVCVEQCHGMVLLTTRMVLWCHAYDMGR